MRLLLVEDKESFRRLLCQALAGSSWTVTALGDPREAMEALEAEPFQVLVTDLRLPGFSGLELLKRAKRLRPELRCVLMSAFGEARDIVEAMRSGADDFLAKPFDLDDFQAVLERLRALAGAPPPDPREPWVAASPALRRLDADLARASEAMAPALFHGEAGTGRSRAARRLHALRDPQAPFLALGAAELGPGGPEPAQLDLLRGGTLLLRDLESLPAAALPALLQALESPAGRGLRWMATCRDPQSLPPALGEGLGVLRFPLPPLRERREELPALLRCFMESAARRQGRPLPVLDPQSEREALQRRWEGNLRELAWCVEQALAATTGALLAPLPRASSGTLLPLPWPAPGNLDAMLAQVGRAAEEQLLRRALLEAKGEPAAAARALGLTPRALAQRLREHSISLEDGA